MSSDIRSPVATVHPDAEELAAFVDGRLSGAARERMVSHLADCEPCHEVMVDLVTVLRDPALASAEEEEDEGDDVSLAPAGKVLRPPAERFRRALPLAAAVAAAALVALLVWTPAGTWILDPFAPSVATVAELSDPALVAAAADRPWAIDEHGWPVDRGGEGAISPATVRAFQLGVRNAELHLAMATDAGESVAILAGRAENLLIEDPATGILVSLYTPPRTLERLREADRQLRELLPANPPWYPLGRWAGVALVAVEAGHPEWFGEAAPRRTLRALRRHEWPGEVREPLERVAALAADGVSRAEAEEMSAALETLTWRAGGGG